MKKITIVNVYSKGFAYLKDKENSPFVLELPCDLTNVFIPNNIIRLDVFETIDNDDFYKFSIYVGRVLKEEMIRRLSPNYIHCDCIDESQLSKITDETLCICYKDGNKLVLVSKLNPNDIVVEDIDELKYFLTNMSLTFNNDKTIKRTRDRRF